MSVNTAPNFTTKPKTKPKTVRACKARARKAKPFNAKNLATHMKALLEDQYIENVLRFYTPEIIAMVEGANPELKELIRKTAEKCDDVAAICVQVDAVRAQLGSPRQCAD